MPYKFLFPLVAGLALLCACGSGGKASLATPSSNVAASPAPAANGGTPAADPTAPTGASTPAATPAPAATGSAAPAPAAEAPAGSLPAVPANAQAFDQIQNTTDNWQNCSLCALGWNHTGNFWMAPFQTQPSVTGSSRQLFIGGLPWSNALFIKTIPGSNPRTHFLWDFYIYLDGNSAPNIWTAEADLWQAMGHREFMIGSQCNFGDGWWDVWDTAHNKWLHSSIPCQRWAGNTWHHVQWYVESLPATSQYRYDTLVVDGVAHTMNLTFGTAPTSWQDGIGVQWQLDQSANGAPLHEWIDNVKLWAW